MAAELGIRPPLLYSWARTEGPPADSPSGPKRLRSMEGLEAEIRRLRAENTKLFEQREVLKKSLGILSEPGQGWLYLVAVLDVFTRQVIGWAMHQILDARLVIAALRMALLQRRPGAALIVHSDRGMQFASAAYRQVLAQHGLIASMSRRGNCYDNAFIESFWSSLKYEVVYHQRFATFAEARNAIFNYIETFYNRTRLHSSLAYRSPIAFESQLTTSHTN